MTTYIADRKKMAKRLTGFRALQGDRIDSLDPAIVARLDKMIAKFEQPQRVVLAGLGDSDHHALASLFAGTPLIAEAENTAACPSLKLCYGAEARTSTVVGGRNRAFRGCVLDKLISLEADSLIQLDLPTMLMPHIEFSVLPIYDAHDDQSRYLFDLVEGDHAVIWCSDATTPWHPRERRLWFTVPDDLKQRSILAMTGAGNVPKDETTRQAYEDKCEFTAEEFAHQIPIALEAMIAAAPAGKVRDQDAFAAAGGQVFLDALIKLTDGNLLANAQALRTELDTIPIGTVQATSPAPELSPTLSETRADPAVGLQKRIADGARTCMDAAKASGSGDTAPVFDAMTELLSDMADALRGDIELSRDHKVLVGQLDEAKELVVLLGYEGTELAVQEAADLLRQITVDVLDRLPAAEELSESSHQEFREAS